MAANPVVGTWHLVEFVVRDMEGTTTYPFGREVTGILTYTADGFMAVQFGRAIRDPLVGSDWWAATAEAIGEVARDYFAYSGTYTYHAGEVVHQIMVSLMPNWVGGTQVRQVQLEGDQLILATPPTPVGGRQQVATLVWHRVSSAER
jgi:hypothetical protein